MNQVVLNHISWLGDARVQELLPPDVCREAVTQALIAHRAGNCDQPLKPYVRPGGRENEYHRGRLISMPAYVGQPVDALGVKLIAGFPVNVERGLPRANGLVCLFDAETGIPSVVMDCHTLSARRTAAVAAICVDHLGSLVERRVGILGAGPIAKETLLALAATSACIVRFCIYDPRRDRVDNLVDEARGQIGVEIEVGISAEACVRASNVIITATAGGAAAYLKRDWLQDDWLLVALSLDDCEPEVMLDANKLICDDFEQGNREEKLLHRLTADGRLVRDDVYAELGEIVAGKKRGREARESIYANCMGMAVEDIAVAQHVYERSLRSSEAVESSSASGNGQDKKKVSAQAAWKPSMFDTRFG